MFSVFINNLNKKSHSFRSEMNCWFLVSGKPTGHSERFSAWSNSSEFWLCSLFRKSSGHPSSLRIGLINNKTLLLVMPSNIISICNPCGKNGKLVAKGMCKLCYQKYGAPFVVCKNCNKKKAHHGRGLCGGCYNKIYRYDRIKRSNIKRYHSIPYELWQDLTRECLICGFGKIVDLHHVDYNRCNNSRGNLIGLCPNHHKMVHTSQYKVLIEKQIATKLTKGARNIHYTNRF